MKKCAVRNRKPIPSGRRRNPAVLLLVLFLFIMMPGFAVRPQAGTRQTAADGICSRSAAAGSSAKIARRITSGSVVLSKTSYLYDGHAKKPSVTVKFGSKKLRKNRDYTVTYKNNTKRGTASVTVKGIGVYTGTVTKTFRIR